MADEARMPAPRRARTKARPVQPRATEPALMSLARQVRGWADNVINIAGSAADMGLALAQSRASDPKQKASISRAGKQLRRWRETAGLTLEEVSQAVGLGDARLIEQAEGGLVALPFEVVLRLAGILGRRDPLPVAMALTRQYNPDLWKALESIGVGKLVVQGTRERELANIYRGCDAARALDDEQFAAALTFTRQAFEMAVAFSGRPGGGRSAGARSAADRATEVRSSATRDAAAATAESSTRRRRTVEE